MEAQTNSIQTGMKKKTDLRIDLDHIDRQAHMLNEKEQRYRVRRFTYTQ